MKTIRRHPSAWLRANTSYRNNSSSFRRESNAMRLRCIKAWFCRKTMTHWSWASIFLRTTSQSRVTSIAMWRTRSIFKSLRLEKCSSCSSAAGKMAHFLIYSNHRCSMSTCYSSICTRKTNLMWSNIWWTKCTGSTETTFKHLTSTFHSFGKFFLFLTYSHL